DDSQPMRMGDSANAVDVNAARTTADSHALHMANRFFMDRLSSRIGARSNGSAGHLRCQNSPLSRKCSNAWNYCYIGILINSLIYRSCLELVPVFGMAPD